LTRLTRLSVVCLWARALQGTLAISCAVKMESESSRFTDELNIYRSYLDGASSGRSSWATRAGSGHAQLMSANCGKIHKDRDDYMEQAGKYTYEGHRRQVPGSRGHVLYEVSFKVSGRPQSSLSDSNVRYDTTGIV